MKRIRSLYIGFVVVIHVLAMTGCDSRVTMKELQYSLNFNLCIYRFNNPAYKDYVIGTKVGCDLKLPAVCGPRRDVDDLFFGYQLQCIEDAKRFSSEYYNPAASPKYNWQICDVAEGPRMVELHEGYFMWYPFEMGYELQTSGELSPMWSQYYQAVVLTTKWEDICNVNNDTLHVLSEKAYSAGMMLEAYDYLKESTLEEVVSFINNSIDNDFNVDWNYGSKGFGLVRWRKL